MNWYTLSCHAGQNDASGDILGASIIPIDSLENEKVLVSEKLRYELRDILKPGWIIYPSYIMLSDNPLEDRSLIGKEIVLNASAIYEDNNIIAMRFEADGFDSNKIPLNMLVSSRQLSIPQEDIDNSMTWREYKNFSLYSFLANLGKDFSVIL